MKKYLPIVNLVLLIIIFCYCFYIFSNVSILSAEIETIKNGTSIQSQIGMDWIIGLIDSNFSTIITFVTVLFSMLGLITFVGIREQFKFSIERLEKRFKKQRDESIVHIKRLESIEGVNEGAKLLLFFFLRAVCGVVLDCFYIFIVRTALTFVSGDVS